MADYHTKSQLVLEILNEINLLFEENQEYIISIRDDEEKMKSFSNNYTKPLLVRLNTVTGNNYVLVGQFILNLD